MNGAWRPFGSTFFGQGDSDGPFEKITTTLAVQQTQAALDLVTARDMTESGSSAQALEGSSPSSRQPSVAISPAWHSNVLWWTLRKSFA